MFSIRLLSAALVMLFFIPLNANALSVDDKTLNNGDMSRFSDPDESMPSPIIHLSPAVPAANLQPSKEASQSGSVDTSSVRYEYDKDSGNFVPAYK